MPPIRFQGALTAASTEDRTVTVVVTRDRVEVMIAHRDPAAPTATDEQGAA